MMKHFYCFLYAFFIRFISLLLSSTRAMRQKENFPSFTALKNLKSLPSPALSESLAPEFIYERSFLASRNFEGKEGKKFCRNFASSSIQVGIVFKYAMEIYGSVYVCMWLNFVRIIRIINYIFRDIFMA
jgi:hypothetical protein